jgi:N-methylhydantoinase A/oxoprolinase/acetone carboxylase beta subunit
VFSAVGLLAAPEQVDLVQSWPTPLDHDGLEAAMAALAEAARAALGAYATATSTFDGRYAGQGHELTVESVAAFHALHARRNGYSRPDDAVEAVALRGRATIASPVAVADLPVPERRALVGPTVVAEADCTTWVPDGWRAEVGAAGALVMRRVTS